MHSSLPADPVDPRARAAPRLFKKRVADDTALSADSTSLFRFGEQCNYRCPMCSNTGDPALFFHETEELLRRAAFLRDFGFKRVMVTGGEPTIHPGFWTVVEQLASDAMRWDINTHGRSFSQPGFAARAFDTGLQRAIVSMHSFDPTVGAAIFGVQEKAHAESLDGIEQMVAAGVEVVLNCVLNRLNLAHLGEYLSAARSRFGGDVAFKFVFPTMIGKGGNWPAIAELRYDDVRDSMRTLRARVAELGARVSFESFPNCVLGDRDSVNVGRSGFGESHYLDDATGDQVYAMRHIEAELSAYADVCRRCSVLPICPGISRLYARKFGVSELVPWTDGPGDRQGGTG